MTLIKTIKKATPRRCWCDVICCMLSVAF